MTPAERKRAIRAQFREMKRAARQRLDNDPRVKAARAKRNRRRLIALCIALLLLLFIRCDCGPPPIPPPPVIVIRDAGVPARDAGIVRVPRKPLHGKLETTPRGEYGLGMTGTPTWLEEFRVQVAARSLRLAQCFTGSDRPGAIRWSVSVDPYSGALADHELEGVGTGGEILGDQRKCVIEVLSKPGYHLTAPDAGALPDRVSMVVEF